MVDLPRGRGHGADHQLLPTSLIDLLAADPLRFLLRVNAVGEMIPVLLLFEAGHLVKGGYIAHRITGIIPSHRVLTKAPAVAVAYRKVLVQDLIAVRAGVRLADLGPFIDFLP